MQNETKEKCLSCGNEECSCETEPKIAIKRNVTINFDDNEDFSNTCDCCEEENCDCENKKKALAVLGATVVAIGVAGGILYLVKNKK